MPLITKMLPSGEHVDAFPTDSSLHSQEERLGQVREEKDFDDFEEYNDEDEALDSDMEGSILHRPRPKKPIKQLQVPSLPQRSEKRASKILQSVLADLKNLEDTAKEEAERISALQTSDPHEEYLSSEEDASLSDYEGSMMDFEILGDEQERNPSRASRRKSEEVTARMVSFMVVGKPQIVNIFSISPTTSFPTSRHSMNLEALASLTSKSASSSLAKSAPRRPAPLTLYPSSMRRMSLASTTSYIPQTANSLPMAQQNASMCDLSKIPSQANSTIPQQHPKRKSSRMGLSSLTSLVTNPSLYSYSNSTRKSSFAAASTPMSASSNHSFLQSDPFAHRQQNATYDLPPTPSETPITPKTPTSMLKGLSRSFSKATRKQSIPRLNSAYQAQVQAHAQASTSTLSVASSQRRSSTSHSHQSAITTSSFNSNSQTQLERIVSNPEPETPKLLDQGQVNPMEAQLPVRRSETMFISPSPRHSTFSQSEITRNANTYEDIMREVKSRGPPPEPVKEKEVEKKKEGRKSFSMMSMGMGRRKSVRR